MTVRLWIRRQAPYRDREHGVCQVFNSLPGVALDSVAQIHIYDVFHADDDDLSALRDGIILDPRVDEELTTDDVKHLLDTHAHLAVEARPGQYDARADAAEQLLALARPHTQATIKSADLYVFSPRPTAAAMDAITRHVINPVDTRAKALDVLTLPPPDAAPPVTTYPDFVTLAPDALSAFRRTLGLSLSDADLTLCQRWFQAEGRAPTDVELRVLDTYWSDHCRHTTFHTHLTSIVNASVRDHDAIDRALCAYKAMRHANGMGDQPPTFMDMATLAARDARRRGALDSVEVSDEVNACCVDVDADNGGVREPWCLLFKNETHNHPTEIEPFGGAATCLGGAIRDPLSGRAYVYQAMRLSGAGDINTPREATRPHKRPQRDVSRTAALGFSRYGNEVGLATTYVREWVHSGYVAKRLELGAVVGAVPRDHLRRARPRPGDVVLLVGGRTGRDGVGGATGSSHAHTDTSSDRAASEVQKGNPVNERKLQRFFRHADVARAIRVCNDFGAGGVAVAVGELASGLDIDLDQVPLKYSGLSAVDIAISESQERMACLVAPEDVAKLMHVAEAEHLDAVVLATVTREPRLRMRRHGAIVLDLTRSFLDTNGAPRSQRVVIRDRADAPQPPTPRTAAQLSAADVFAHLAAPNHGTERGLSELFDATVGRTTVLAPYGGRFQASEEGVSAHTLPTSRESTTVSVLAAGYRPDIADRSAFQMGAYSLIESLSRLVAAGVDPTHAWLSCQEYFPSLGDSPEAWGHVAAALLGSFEAQTALGVVSIGGKDSMSGSFNDLHVPPTLVAFTVGCSTLDDVTSSTLPNDDLHLVVLPHRVDAAGRPHYDQLKRQWHRVHDAIMRGDVAAAAAVQPGGLLPTLVKMALGNRPNVTLERDDVDLVGNAPGGVVLATRSAWATDNDTIILGRVQRTQHDGQFQLCASVTLSYDDLDQALERAYGTVFPSRAHDTTATPRLPDFACALPRSTLISAPRPRRTTRPRVLLPVFPGTNCEDDTAKAFAHAGADCIECLVRAQNVHQTAHDRTTLIETLADVDIVALSGGFSFADEPDGAAKGIAAFLRHPEVREAMRRFLASDGLVIGICNGFQALLKAGYLPYGLESTPPLTAPTLIDNRQGQHVARFVTTRVVSTASPWLRGLRPGQCHTLPVSHGEGRFVVSPEEAERLFARGLVAFQYVDPYETPTLSAPWNPNGSAYAIEGLISPDGRILGKMGHSERVRPGLYKNIPDVSPQPLFANAVAHAMARAQPRR